MGHKIQLLGVVLIIALTSICWCQNQSSQSPAYLRLHVLAHSNLEEDQRVKLLVRDEILNQIRQLSFDSHQPCMETLSNHLPEIKKRIELVLEKEKKEYPLYLQVGNFNFPAKSYDKQQFILPAGQYPALNVIIGAGEGRNWWCVLFPSLCVTAEAWQESEDSAQDVVIELKISQESKLRIERSENINQDKS